MEAIALYAFHDDPREIQASADQDLLTLLAGDRVQVLAQEDSGWWSGINLRTGKSGWFPASFAELKENGSLGKDDDITAGDGKPCPGNPDWMQYMTDDQQIYYVHRVTGESSWSLPERSPKDNFHKRRSLAALNPNRISVIPLPPLDVPEPILPEIVEEIKSTNNNSVQELASEFDTLLAASKNNVTRVADEEADIVDSKHQAKKSSALGFFKGIRRQPSNASSIVETTIISPPITPPHLKKSNDPRVKESNKENQDPNRNALLKASLTRTTSKVTPPLITINKPLANDDPLEQKRRLTAVPVKEGPKTSAKTKPAPPVAVEKPAPPQQQAQPDATGKYGYANNFWADRSPTQSGFDILVLKHRNGKEMCKDIAQFMNERARIEEQYARSLMELSKTTLGAMELGTSKTAWNQVKFDVEAQARARLAFSQQIQKEVEQKIMSFKNEQKVLRKNYEATIGADRKLLMSKLANAMKMRKLYEARCRDAELAEEALRVADQQTTPEKELVRLEENARKERKRAGIAGLDYKSAVEQYERIRIRWEDDMTAACGDFQQAEEERIDFLKNVLQSYRHAQKTVNESCMQSAEMVENSIDAVSKDVDIEMYVKSNFTGSEKPVPLHFEQHSSLF